MSQETRARKKYAPGKAVRRLTERDGRPAEENVLELTPQEHASEQERRRAVLISLFAQAEALVPDPPDSPTRAACRDSLIDDAIVEKFRRQGFNL